MKTTRQRSKPMRTRYCCISVRRHGPGGHVAAIRQTWEDGGRRLHVTDPHRTPQDAANAARSWARTHGLRVRYTAYEHGLLGPCAVGDTTVESW